MNRRRASRAGTVWEPHVDRLARHLQNQGVPAEGRVGVAMPRSLELLVALGHGPLQSGFVQPRVDGVGERLHPSYVMLPARCRLSGTARCGPAKLSDARS